MDKQEKPELTFVNNHRSQIFDQKVYYSSDFIPINNNFLVEENAVSRDLFEIENSLHLMIPSTEHF